MDNGIFEKLKEMVVNQIGIKADNITPTSDIINDLGCDSLDIVDMLMTIEVEYGLTVNDEDVAKLKTVEDVVNFIEANRSK